MLSRNTRAKSCILPALGQLLYFVSEHEQNSSSSGLPGERPSSQPYQRPNWSIPRAVHVQICRCLKEGVGSIVCIALVCLSGFPRWFEVLKKHWISKSVFKILKKYWIWPKWCVKYWKSMEILNGKEIWNIRAEFNWRQSMQFIIYALFMQCPNLSFMIKYFKKWREAMVFNFLI